ncbi:peptidase M56 family protein [Arthrobacter sp. CDRTa11]|uniref:peptidase M56 family protein n=1 Tax=Arthrobacter sp. CDRTa11 TaxID=2651199 RepID=UPI002265EDF7|nr:peptidase M56 family protein [Arthrobacter sp. CDRTa11]
MNQLQVDEQFSTALRAELVSKVQQKSPARRHTRLWLGAGVLAGTGILGGVGATAAGLFVVPGSPQVSTLSTPVPEATYQGPATIELGEPPEGTTGIQMDFTCLTPGLFQYQDGSRSICSPEDVGTPQAWSGYLVQLAPGQHSVTFRTEPENRWKVTAKYVSVEIGDWETNADGDTYGAENENGIPDLIAVIATNGTPGYVYRTELEEANGTAAMKTFKSPEEAVAWQEARGDKDSLIPVYDTTGKTVVGEFAIAGGNGSVGTAPPVKNYFPEAPQKTAIPVAPN